MTVTDSFQKCLAIIAVGADAIQAGKVAMAEGAFKMALAGARSCAPEEATHLVPVIHLNQSLLRTKQGRSEEAQELRKEAIAALDWDSARSEETGISYLTVSVLQQLGDYRRAIPSWEQAIRLADPNGESDGMASMLHSLGECYSRIGLKDHAVVPLRAALRLLDFCHEDPRRSAILITLGNALRKTAPGEAEACYKEVADLHQSRLEYKAATPAWGNLGVLCSEQGRFAEALDYFQKVQRIREQTPGTQGTSLAITHSNIAVCYMRMGRITEAHESADHALQLLTGSDLNQGYDLSGIGRPHSSGRLVAQGN